MSEGEPAPESVEPHLDIREMKEQTKEDVDGAVRQQPHSICVVAIAPHSRRGGAAGQIVSPLIPDGGAPGQILCICQDGQDGPANVTARKLGHLLDGRQLGLHGAQDSRGIALSQDQMQQRQTLPHALPSTSSPSAAVAPSKPTIQFLLARRGRR